MPSQPPPGDDPAASAASVADEARKLVESLTRWAGAEASAATQQAEAPPPQSAAEGCCSGPLTERVCGICPVCRVAGFVDALSPEIIDRMADFVGMAAASLHALANDRRGPSPEQTKGSDAGTRHTTSVPVDGDEDDDSAQ
ncbi:hypothetical protein G9U51_09165 [Calidifontibacter sp. DB0510]|uniref:Uncharacterized protein n=1 Tax=Metallococcus carri TaxID=1656884 RepID=A0A967B0A4_9MICO|nr:hypothetical protein [Metallococcus carri]NHN55943.1 hypothetical protein [Metallococcus carri]NOP37600.1 hypothetical protein [Calidifontibacter sp. DB2511S]